MLTLQSKFEIRSRAIIDDDTSLVVHITAIMWSEDGIQCRVAYMHNGENKTAWIEEWRLSAV